MVKFIQDTGIKQHGKRGYMFALFQCPICNKIFERPKHAGKNLIACRECAYRVLRVKRLKHGQRYTRLYRTWINMRSRCNNPREQHFKHYGAKGIKVCPEWDNFEVFKQFALENGYTDSLTIDRVDVTKGYDPTNVQFVPLKINAGKDKVVISEKLYFEIKKANKEEHILLPVLFAKYGVSGGAYYNARNRYE